MDKWYSAKDLTGMPGIPKTISGVVRKAKREKWLAKHSDGRGGGLLYHYNSLPGKTRDTLHNQHNNTLPVERCKNLVAGGEIKVDLTSLKKWQRDIFAARLALYREFERLLAIHGYTKAVNTLVLSAKTGTLPGQLQPMVAQANARKGKARTLSVSMVKGWHRTVKKDGITALAPKPAKKENVPAWASYFNKIYGRPQKPSLAEAMRELETVLPENIELPSYHQVRRYHQKRSRLERQKGRYSAPALKRFKGFIRRSTDNLLPTDVVQCDGHSFKSKISHPVHGRPFKPEVCAVIDVKTKLVLGWSAGLAESAHTVADALRHSMTVNENKPWGGVPAILYTDKGAGNMAHMLGDAVTGILTRAGITHHTGIPGNAQGRGLVEKTNQQLWISAAKKLQTFVGSGMDELVKRKIYLEHEKEVRQTGTCRTSSLPSWPEFLEICNAAVLNYNNKPHSGLPKMRDSATDRIRHMTPFEAWFTTIRDGWRPTMLDPAILHDLFRPQIVRTTIRNEVSLFNNVYYEKALEHYNGEKIIVEYDIHDPETVRIRDMDQRLICLAHHDRNKKDFFPVPVVEIARDVRYQGRKKLKERQLEEIELERHGTVMDADYLIAADPESVDRQMIAGVDNDILQIENTPMPEEAIVPEIKPLLQSESERFNLILADIRGKRRPLSPKECSFLNNYYQTDGGRAYMSMVGDLRQEYGVAEDENEATL